MFGVQGHPPGFAAPVEVHLLATWNFIFIAVHARFSSPRPRPQRFSQVAHQEPKFEILQRRTANAGFANSRLKGTLCRSIVRRGRKHGV
jgi:hypothetical protein